MTEICSWSTNNYYEQCCSNYGAIDKNCLMICSNNFSMCLTRMFEGVSRLYIILLHAMFSNIQKSEDYPLSSRKRFSHTSHHSCVVCGVGKTRRLGYAVDIIALTTHGDSLGHHTVTGWVLLWAFHTFLKQRSLKMRLRGP